MSCNYYYFFIYFFFFTFVPQRSNKSHMSLSFTCEDMDMQSICLNWLRDAQFFCTAPCLFCTISNSSINIWLSVSWRECVWEWHVLLFLIFCRLDRHTILPSPLLEASEVLCFCCRLDFQFASLSASHEDFAVVSWSLLLEDSNAFFISTSDSPHHCCHLRILMRCLHGLSFSQSLSRAPLFPPSRPSAR